jgi:hypothetical protein
MKRQSFSSYDQGYLIAELEFDETQLYGIGGSTYPRLLIPITLHFNPLSIPRLVDLAYTDLSARLILSPNGEKVADSLPIKVDQVRRGEWTQTSQTSLTLEFPLDATRIAYLESVRNGNDLNLSLDLRLSVQEFTTVLGDPKTRPKPEWGLRYLISLLLKLEFKVPRSVWIDKVLPQVGYGVIHIIELPAIPLENCQPLDHSFQALRQAQQRHREGLYDDAVGKCRIALEKFFEPVEVTGVDNKTRKVPQLKKSWEVKLGNATYDWLSGAATVMKNATNKPHHSPNAHYSQLDSQMIIVITTALVAYAARSDFAEVQ